jgi:probable HAF family extracellular repeat protein
MFLTAQAGMTRDGGMFTASAAAAQTGPVSWTLTTVDYPGFVSVTAPIDMNNLGDMVGYYDNPGGVFHGYLKLKDAPFVPVDFPGAAATVTVGINDNRDVVGVYIDQAGFQHGFRLSNGVFTSIDVPGAAQTRGVTFEFGGGLGTAAFGINNNGDIVGEYADENKVAHGFLLRDGQYTTIDAPDAPQLPGTESMAVRINSHGDIVGSVNIAAWRESRGFLLKDGQYTTIEHPESAGYFGTVAVGLNDHGDVAGSFTGPSNSANDFHGFALVQGQYYRIDFPGAAYTETYNINNNQSIVGGYKGSDRRMHGYVGVRNNQQ